MRKFLFLLLALYGVSAVAKPTSKVVDKCIDGWAEMYRAEAGYQDAFIRTDQIQEWESLCKKIPQSAKICKRISEDGGQCKIDYFLDL